MTATPGIRRSRPEELERLLALKCRIFPGCTEEQELQRWKWQFEANPARSLGLPEAFVLEVGGAVRGYYVVIPYRVHVGTGTVAGACGADLCVVPEARGQGLAHALLAPHWGEGLCAFPFASGVNPASLYLLTAHGATLLGGSRDPLGFACTVSAAPPGSAAPSLEVEPLETCGAAEDAFWLRWSRERHLCLVKDAAYLNWRYRDFPFQPCRLFRARGSAGETRGLAALQADPANGCLYVLELLACRGDSAALRGLLLAARRAAQEAGVAVLYTTTRSEDQPPVLAEQGFQRHPGDVPTFMGKLNGAAAHAGVRVEDWEPSLGDGDTFFMVGSAGGR